MKRFSSIKQAARAMGVNASTIARVANNNGYHKTAKGFKWVFAERSM